MTHSSRKDARLRSYYGLYLEIGLILALIVLVTAARMNLSSGEDEFQVRLQTQEVVNMEDIQQTEQEMETPPPPKAPVPQEVPDNVVVEQEDVDFDASLDLSASLDTTQAAPGEEGEPEGLDDEEEEGQDEIFVAVEQEPELVGGLAALQREIEYPEFAIKAGLEGTVFVEFVVDEEGNVQDPEVARGVHKLLDEEALRVVKKMTFEPGRQRNTPVKVRMTMPVTFTLKDGKPVSGGGGR